MSHKLDITKFVMAFRDAMLALHPVFIAIGLSWKMNEKYDDFDTIETALYVSIIQKQIDPDEVYNALAPVGYREIDYGAFSFIDIELNGSVGIFIGFESKYEPMDHICFLSEGTEKLMPISNVELAEVKFIATMKKK
jgi:hypothetical protein